KLPVHCALYPELIVNNFSTVVDFIFSETSQFLYSGKKDITLSSSDKRFSLKAKPIAVAVTLFVKENIKCLFSISYGCHAPSDTTSPFRAIIKLCNSISLFSTDSKNERIADDDIPCFSGVLLFKFTNTPPFNCINDN